MRLSLPDKKTFTMLLAMVLTAVTGCMRDDYAVCPDEGPEGITVNFRYDYNIAETDLFRSVVNRVELYVYDSVGVISDIIELTAEQLAANDHKATLITDIGEYTLVAIMNRTAAYEITGTQNFNTARLERSLAGQFPSDNEPEAVFHALATTTVLTGNEEVDMSFIKNSSLITVDMIFEDKLPDDLEVESVIIGAHGFYDFRNLPVRDTDPITYTPHEKLTYTDDNILSSYLLDRIMTDDDLSLTISQIRNGRERTIEDIDLVDAIMQNPDYNNQEKLDRNDNFPIKIHLKYVETSLLVSEVYIGDWKVINSSTGL